MRTGALLIQGVLKKTITKKRSSALQKKLSYLHSSIKDGVSKIFVFMKHTSLLHLKLATSFSFEILLVATLKRSTAIHSHPLLDGENLEGHSLLDEPHSCSEQYPCNFRRYNINNTQIL